MGLTVDLIERARRRIVLNRCPGIGLPRMFKAHLAHQPEEGAASEVEAFPLQLPPNLAHAVNPEVLLEHAPDLDLEILIPFCRGRPP